MRVWNNLMLKTKLFIAFSAVSLILVSLTCYLLYYKNDIDAKNQAFLLSTTISKQYSKTIDLFIKDTEKYSLSIFGDTVIQSELFDHYHSTDSFDQLNISSTLVNRLFYYAFQRPYLQGLYLFTLDGEEYSLDYTDSNRGLLDESWYKNIDLLENRRFLLLPTAEEKTNGNKTTKVISFVRSINNIPSRHAFAYLKINIDAAAIRDILISSIGNQVEQKMRVLVATNDGHFIYDNENLLTGSSDPSFDTSIFNGNHLSGELQWKGKQYLYSIEKSDYTTWNTIVLVPNNFVLLMQKKFQLVIILVGIIATLLIAAVSYFLSHQITLPLRNLMRKMYKVEQGDFSQRVELIENNEIGRLSRLYNNMLDSISRLIHEVYESKLAEKNAQLSALQAQINPHFLYNTLNTMKSISRIKGIEEVAEMSESLAELFQYSMKNLQHPVSLREEMMHIDNYMKIQRHRFGGRYEMRYSIPEALMDASVLKLTIQPLVENAMIHGLSKKKSGGVIEIRAVRKDNRLVIEVSDNGKGITGEKLGELLEELHSTKRFGGLYQAAHGIGLQNIQQRIQLYYGNAFGMGISSETGQGTTVRLEFPFTAQLTGEERNELA